MKPDRLFPWTIEAIRRGGMPAIALFSFHVVAAAGFQVYDRFPSFDIPMHFLGGFVIAFFFHRASIAASEHGLLGAFHPVTHAVLVFALTCTATVFWEFAEFLPDHFLGTHFQDSLEDTLGDMLLGICGGITLLVVARFVAGGNEAQSVKA